MLNCNFFNAEVSLSKGFNSCPSDSILSNNDKSLFEKTSSFYSLGHYDATRKQSDYFNFRILRTTSKTVLQFYVVNQLSKLSKNYKNLIIVLILNISACSRYVEYCFTQGRIHPHPQGDGEFCSQKL